MRTRKKYYSKSKEQEIGKESVKNNKRWEHARKKINKGEINIKKIKNLFI